MFKVLLLQRVNALYSLIAYEGWYYTNNQNCYEAIHLDNLYYKIQTC